MSKNTLRHSLGGYNVEFSTPKHGFESRCRIRKRRFSEGYSSRSKSGVSKSFGCIAQLVLEYFAVNKKVDGSIPSTTVFYNFSKK